MAVDVSGFPGKDSGEEKALCEGVLKGGAGAVKEICAQLAPLGTEGKDDTKARYALTALARYGGTNEAARAALVAGIGEGLGGQSDTEVKAFLIDRLVWAGKEDAVGTLSGYLKDEKLADHAAMALERIATPAAEAALIQALAGAQGNAKLAIVKSLGALRSKGAVGELAKAASSTDQKLRMAALWGLANSGAQGEMVSGAAESAKGLDRAKLLSYQVLYAQRLAEGGKKEEAAALLRGMVAKHAERDGHAASAALFALVDVLGEGALGDLLAAVGKYDVKIRNAALFAAEKIGGPAATGKWAELVSSSGTSPEVKVDVLALLGRRGDVAGLGAVTAALKDADPAVRGAAQGALVKLAGDGAVEALVAIVKTGDAPDANTSAELLGRMKGEKALLALAGALKEATVKGKVLILDTLGARSASGQKEAILGAVSDADAGVRASAARALERVAGPADVQRLVELAVSTPDEATQSAALRAVTAAAGQISDPEQRSAAVLGAAAKASGAKRVALLRVLPKLGGMAALDALVAELKSEEKANKDAALRALAEWPDTAAVAPLLGVASSDAPLAQQVLALRGVTQILTNAKIAATEKAPLYEQAMKAAKRPEEKKLVLGALAGERHAATLAVAAAALEDPQLKAEASLAVIRIVLPGENARQQPGLKGADVAAALEKAIGACWDAQMKAKAEGYLRGIKKKG